MTDRPPLATFVRRGPAAAETAPQALLGIMFYWGIWAGGLVLVAGLSGVQYLISHGGLSAADASVVGFGVGVIVSTIAGSLMEVPE